MMCLFPSKSGTPKKAYRRRNAIFPDAGPVLPLQRICPCSTGWRRCSTGWRRCSTCWRRRRSSAWRRCSRAWRSSSARRRCRAWHWLRATGKALSPCPTTSASGLGTQDDLILRRINKPCRAVSGCATGTAGQRYVRRLPARTGRCTGRLCENNGSWNCQRCGQER